MKCCSKYLFVQMKYSREITRATNEVDKVNEVDKRKTKMSVVKTLYMHVMNRQQIYVAVAFSPSLSGSDMIGSHFHFNCF